MATLYRLEGLADAIFAVAETGATEVIAEGAMFGIQSALKRDLTDLREAASGWDIVVAAPAPVAAAPAASTLGDIGDELAKLRARAAVLETMLVDLDGEALARAHDGLNQQANDVASGLDALIRRIDGGERSFSSPEKVGPAEATAEAVQQEAAADCAFEYSDLESDISDLRDMSDLANSFIEECLGRPLTRVEIGDQKMRAVTEREADIILFSVYRVGAMTKELSEKFYAIRERKPS
ncbi:hypothetical protein A1351_06765 [Methylosinus sp. R-45379]|nr:hypothetical protein A1351_06765 [Methylosinus sp. R-45379]